jgi:hypothetical protein
VANPQAPAKPGGDARQTAPNAALSRPQRARRQKAERHQHQQASHPIGALIGAGRSREARFDAGDIDHPDNLSAASVLFDRNQQ